jgi:hypothetical protein
VQRQLKWDTVDAKYESEDSCGRQRWKPGCVG